MITKFVCALTLCSTLFVGRMGILKDPVVQAEDFAGPVRPTVVEAVEEKPAMAEEPSVEMQEGNDFGAALQRVFADEPKQLEKATKYTEIAMPIAEEYDVDWQLVTAVMAVESSFNAKAVSPVGARGLMQLMPDTAAMYDVKKNQLDVPEHNIKAGVLHLRRLRKIYPDDLKLVLAAYNAGEGNVARHGGIPPFEETQNYVRKVLNHYHHMM